MAKIRLQCAQLLREFQVQPEISAIDDLGHRVLKQASVWIKFHLNAEGIPECEISDEYMPKIIDQTWFGTDCWVAPDDPQAEKYQVKKASPPPPSQPDEEAVIKLAEGETGIKQKPVKAKGK